MKSNPKSPRAKDARAPIHLKRFGGLNALYFDDGGYARMQMNGLEIKRLLEAVQRYVLRKQRLPNLKLLAAIDRLHDFFEAGGVELIVTADVPIAFHGVTLEVIEPSIP
jgi:hypothetical protein